MSRRSKKNENSGTSQAAAGEQESDSFDDGENGVAVDETGDMEVIKAKPYEFGEEVLVRLDEIYFGKNPRLDQNRDAGTLEGMRQFARDCAPDNRTWGNPIWIYPHVNEEGEATEKWDCLDGMGRSLVSMDAGWTEINAKVFTGSREDAELIRMLANEWPRKLTPYELAKFFADARDRLGASSSKELLARLGSRGVNTVSASYYSRLVTAWDGVSDKIKDDWKYNWTSGQFNGRKLAIEDLATLAQFNKADQLYAYDKWRETGKISLKRVDEKGKRGPKAFLFFGQPTVARRPKEVVDRYGEIDTRLKELQDILPDKARAVVRLVVGVILGDGDVRTTLSMPAVKEALRAPDSGFVSSHPAVKPGKAKTAVVSKTTFRAKSAGKKTPARKAQPKPARGKATKKRASA